MIRIGVGIAVAAMVMTSIASAEQTILLSMEGLKGRVPIHGFTTRTENVGGRANCGTVILKKPLDKASSLLIANVFIGRRIAEALIRVRAEDGRIEYDLALQDVVVLSVDQNHDVKSLAEVVESVALQATKYSFNFYSPQRKFGWDCAANRPI